MPGLNFASAPSQNILIVGKIHCCQHICHKSKSSWTYGSILYAILRLSVFHVGLTPAHHTSSLWDEFSLSVIKICSRMSNLVGKLAGEWSPIFWAKRLILIILCNTLMTRTLSCHRQQLPSCWSFSLAYSTSGSHTACLKSSL